MAMEISAANHCAMQSTGHTWKEHKTAARFAKLREEKNHHRHALKKMALVLRLALHWEMEFAMHATWLLLATTHRG